jgi:UDP-2,3-diacylglucosamine hydrolase
VTSARALCSSPPPLGATRPTARIANGESSPLEHEAPTAGTLYILGDLFDFWFEYREAVFRRHFRVLAALRSLVVHGTRVVFLGGNHDFWAGSFLRDEIGCEVHRDPLREEAQGRKLFLAHGDGLGPGDRGYPILRTVLRHPVSIAGFGLLHPDWGMGIADSVSRSCSRRDESKFDAERLCRHLADPLLANGLDAVVIGHYHHPTHLRRERGEFVILGDWLARNTFARLEDGVFALRQWTEAGCRPYPAAGSSGRNAPA